MKYIYKQFHESLYKHTVTLAVALVVSCVSMQRTFAQAAPPPAQPPQPASSPPADADATPMTLARVLEVAIRQKPSLEQAAIDIDIAEANTLEVMGLDDWFFDATGRLSSSRLQAFNLDQDEIALDANLSRRLSTGGTITLHADTGYTRATVTGQMSEETYAHTVSARLSQPLARGRGKRITYMQRRKARLARDAATLARRVEAIAVIRQVVGAYWELAYAWRDLEIRRSSMELTQERLKNTQAAIAAGAVAPTEALAVEQSIVAREEEILGAELTVSQRSLTLRRLAGLPIGPAAIDLMASAPLTIPARTFDVDALLERALSSSPTLSRLASLEQGAELDVELAENGLLPELDLVLSFGPTGSATDPGTALGRMARFDDFTAIASLTYRRSLKRRQARGRTHSARAALLRQKVGIEDVKAQISSSLVVEIRRARAARRRFELGGRAIELARKNVEAEKARFDLGRATNFDVLQRQDELERAQLRQARALIDFLDAIAAVDAITGDILGSYGITLSPPGRDR